MARKSRKSEQLAESSEESQTMRTVDGRNVVVIGKDSIKELSGRRICAGGVSFGCYRHDPHPYAARRRYNDWSRKLMGIKLSIIDVDLVYFCKRCEKYQGCHLCVGDPASLVCTDCHDWANEISEKVHGKMVPRERAHEVMGLVMKVASGRYSEEQANNMFAELFKPRPREIGEEG